MTPRERAELALTGASTAGSVRLPDRELWVRSVADAIEQAEARARAEERERLHVLLEACYGLIDPEEYADVSARLSAELDGDCACSDLRERAVAEAREECARRVEGLLVGELTDLPDGQRTRVWARGVTPEWRAWENSGDDGELGQALAAEIRALGREDVPAEGGPRGGDR